MRIHTRLALLSLAVNMVALGGATLVWNDGYREERRQELDDRLRDQAALLATVSPDPLDSEKLQALVERVHRQTGSRLTFIDREGRVLADSNVPAPEVAGMENHATRPEVVEAMANGVGYSERISSTLKRKMAYVAVQWGPSDAPYGVTRAALWMTRVEEEQARGYMRLFLVFLGSLAFSTLLGYVAARAVSAPLARVTQVAQAIADGDLKLRAPIHGGPESHDLGAAVNSLTDSLRGQITAVEEERRGLARLLEGMPDGVLAVDSRGEIARINASAERLLSIEREAALGLTPLELLRIPELQKIIDAALEGEQVAVTELRLRDPEPRIISAGVVPIESGVVVLLHDVTRLRRLEEARREMVANVGHELRTPLSSILGYVETLLTDSQLQPEDSRRFLEVVQRNARRLERLVDDLSRLAKLEAPESVMQPVPQRLQEVVERILETMSPRTLELGVEIRTDIPAELPMVRADEHALDTVLLNLLDNGLRAAPRGSALQISASQEGDWIRIVVDDAGPGIPKEYRGRVFERFYRLDHGRTSTSGGSGLGLAIVKHTIQLHGGEIRVGTSPLGGARFTFTLPRV